MSSVFRVIIVEDEPELRKNLIIGLSAKGLQVSGAADGAGFDRLLTGQSVDILSA